MPTEHDVQLVESFVNETLDTVWLVIQTGRIRLREREALDAAVRELQSTQPELIIGRYREAPDVDLIDAGVVGQQLGAKVEIPRIFAERLAEESKTRDTLVDSFEESGRR